MKSLKELKLDLDVLYFTQAMKDVLNEKSNKYQNLWKTCDLPLLKTKLLNHLYALELDIKPSRAKRELVHISNYALFLYTRLKDKKEKDI